ncbi:hypothetical protein BC833DRAFT_602400 [Globomyces pollinis-pini]|nr:hypothetical protein BC833DRAFT_602400 [Globomyces pollinis-pini]
MDRNSPLLLFVKIWFPISCLIGFTSLLIQIRKLKDSHYRKAYNILLIVLKLSALLTVVAESIPIYHPAVFASEIGFRIVRLLSLWSAFAFCYLLMICDMEMLRLMSSITPFFTSSRITVIQIVETILSFILGSGLLYFPISDFGPFAAEYLRVSPLLHVLSTCAVVWQCIYISLKMKQFASNDKKTLSNLDWKYQIVLVKIFLFTSLDLLGIALSVYAIVNSAKEDASKQTILDNGLLISISGSILPITVFAYSIIFDSIIAIKFDKLMSQKSLTPIRKVAFQEDAKQAITIGQ